MEIDASIKRFLRQLDALLRSKPDERMTHVVEDFLEKCLTSELLTAIRAEIREEALSCSIIFPKANTFNTVHCLHILQ